MSEDSSLGKLEDEMMDYQTFTFEQYPSAEHYIMSISLEMVNSKRRLKVPLEEDQYKQAELRQDAFDKLCEEQIKFRLPNLLEGFLKQPTFSRSRELWLIFEKSGLAPAREVMEVFVKQNIEETSTWHRPRTALSYAKTKYTTWVVFEKYLDAVKEKLKKDGGKSTADGVYELIARLMSNEDASDMLSGDAVRKKIERSSQEKEPADPFTSAYGYRMDQFLRQYLDKP